MKPEKTKAGNHHSAGLLDTKTAPASVSARGAAVPKRVTGSARTLAATLGQRTYATGKACRHGHVVERETLSGMCIACKRVSTAADRQRIRRLLDAATRRKTP